MKIVIIDYGSGNIKSVKFALERLGIDAELSNEIENIKSADKIIFPGVGEASSAMYELKKMRLNELIPNLKQPVLGICLGMQLMCQFSEESNTDCLNIFPINIKRFSNKQKVPQIGWNNIEKLKSQLFENIKENEFVYFVHSYFAEISNYTIATTNYEVEFSAAINKDNFYACQFHPEKSSNVGQTILKNFINL